MTKCDIPCARSRQGTPARRRPPRQAASTLSSAIAAFPPPANVRIKSKLRAAIRGNVGSSRSVENDRRTTAKTGIFPTYAENFPSAPSRCGRRTAARNGKHDGTPIANGGFQSADSGIGGVTGCQAGSETDHAKSHRMRVARRVEVCAEGVGDAALDAEAPRQLAADEQLERQPHPLTHRSTPRQRRAP